MEWPATYLEGNHESDINRVCNCMAKDTMFASHVNSTEVDIIFLFIFEMKDLRELLIPEPTWFNGGGLAAWKFNSWEISMLCETQSVVHSSWRDINALLNQRNNY